jgi:iron complex outermembrane receptor protein
LPREGTVVPYYDANGKRSKLPTDFNEGEEDNKISRRQKMVGYSFSHQFDDTFTVRQNLRYTKINTLYRSVYGNGYIAPAQSSARYVRSDEDLNSFTVDTQLQSKFATGAVDHTLLTALITCACVMILMLTTARPTDQHDEACVWQPKCRRLLPV